MMQRSGGGLGARGTVGAIRKAHTCTECGKSFRSGEDLFMHAEVCLLDAFEMEASVVQPRQGHGSKRSAGGEVSAGKKRDSSAIMTTQQSPDVAPKPANRTRMSEGMVQEAGNESASIPLDEEDLDEDSDDYEPPPELELAEPNQKKYKRTFPIGDDGKQIRPKMECPTCGLVLYRHNFSTHFRIHTGELPFQCSFCEKRFRTSSALTVHTRCHTGERPYECPHCNYCCITKRNLDRHIINNHVKKTGKYEGGPIRLPRDYYTPRIRVGRSYGMSSGLSLDYGDDFDDDALLEDELDDDEQLDELELEEEARRAEQQLAKSTSAQAAQADPEAANTDAAAVSAGDEGPSETRGQSVERPGTVKSIPILDGPKGVYGDPEADTEDGGVTIKRRSTRGGKGPKKEASA